MKLNTANELPIHITPHHLTLSPALVRFVHAKLAAVTRFAGDVLGADIVLRRHHGTEGKRFSASARLALPGRDVYAAASHDDLYTAIVHLVAKLARRTRKRKTRLTRGTRGIDLGFARTPAPAERAYATHLIGHS